MAKRISTVAKGDAFEYKVYARFKELLEQDMLGLSPNFSQIFPKKQYAGDSGSNIIFDIAIESYHPDSESFSNLTLIECKDHTSPVQVEAIRDFAYRIKDVGGHKGYFITSGHFQDGVVKVARKENIGLARLDLSNNNVNWTLRRIGKDNYRVRRELRENLTSSADAIHPFIAMCGHIYYSSLFDFVTKEIAGRKTNINVPFLTEESIIKTVDQLTDDNVGKYTQRSTEYLMSIVSNTVKARLVCNQSLPHEEIGQCDFAQRIIYISSDLPFDSPRWRFTLAHEIGHFILHEYLYNDYGVAVSHDDETSFDVESIGEESIKRLEIQANLFASHLLVPESALLYKYRLINQQMGIRFFPHLYLDSQPCNIELCETVFTEIGRALNVSTAVIRNRLQSMGLLTIKEAPHRV